MITNENKVIFNIQKLFVGDNRRWEEIPTERFEGNHETTLGEVIDMMNGYIVIHNRLSSNAGLEIAQIRVSENGSYQGHYVIDWEKIYSLKEA